MVGHLPTAPGELRRRSEVPTSAGYAVFDCETTGGKTRMRPFYRVRNEIYSTYFRRT